MCLNILSVAFTGTEVSGVDTLKLSGTHKAVQRSGVVHELLTESGGAEGLHALQANSPQVTLLEQG